MNASELVRLGALNAGTFGVRHSEGGQVFKRLSSHSLNKLRLPRGGGMVMSDLTGGAGNPPRL